MATATPSSSTAAARRVLSMRGGVAASPSLSLSPSRWASTSAQVQAQVQTQSSSSSPSPSTAPPTSPHARPRPRPPLRASLLLSRQPVVLRAPTPLESSVFQYNYALYRRLQTPLARDLYFKKGSAAQVKFDAEEAARRALVDAGLGFRSAEEAGAASASGDGKASSNKGRGRDDDAGTAADTAADDDSTLQAERDLFKVQPRRTPADAAGDTYSLERALDRTLFLVFKQRDTGRWTFPEEELDHVARETLHRAALKPVRQALGQDLDIWNVTNMPVAVWPRPGAHSKSKSTRTYFIRAHLIKGHPQVQSQSQDAAAQSQSSPTLPPLPADHAWLTRQEVQERVLAHGGEESAAYWEGVRDLLCD